MNNSFGGDWTVNKLEILQEYLVAYMTILKNYPYLHPIYVDAFAGSGSIKRPGGQNASDTHAQQQSMLDSEFLDMESVHETNEYIEGSARRALSVAPPFAQYIFVERDLRRAKNLEALKADFPERADRIEICNEDANTFLRDWLPTRDWSRDRAVLFLDPFGMEVDWSMIERVAQTQAIDLWLWFPISGVSRHLTKNSPPPEYWATRVTRTLGTDSWREEFYPVRKSYTLFGDTEESQERDADWDKITAFIVNRLKEIFPRVAKAAIFKNSKNSPLYLFCFATGSPRRTTQDAAIRIANHLLKGH